MGQECRSRGCIRSGVQRASDSGRTHRRLSPDAHNEDTLSTGKGYAGLKLPKHHIIAQWLNPPQFESLLAYGLPGEQD